MRRTGLSIVLLLFSTAESQTIDGPFYTSDLKGSKYTPADQRPGDNLFGESIVCLDAQSGERVDGAPRGVGPRPAGTADLAFGLSSHTT